MQIKADPLFTPQFGDTMIDRGVQVAMEALWDGHLNPDIINEIELGIRGFIFAKRLVSPPSVNERAATRAIHQTDHVFGHSDTYRMPFPTTPLEFEFVRPNGPAPLKLLDGQEAAHLKRTLIKAIRKAGLSPLDRFPKTMEVAQYRLCLHYHSDEVPAEMDLSHQPDLTLDNPRLGTPFSREDFVRDWLPRLADALYENVASYFVRCHGAGMNVCMYSPLGDICNDFVFSKWPRKMFEPMAESYATLLRELRAPGISIEIPPMLALVLSRTNRRSYVPEVLRDLREEYSEGRKQLWNLLSMAWFARTLKEQQEALRQLEAAANSIWGAAFPNKLDVLSTALEVASADVKGGAKRLREYDMDNVRVSRVSFAAKLAKDVRSMTNQRNALKKHLNAEERADFGLG